MGTHFAAKVTFTFFSLLPTLFIADRSALIQEAITEAKAHAKQKEEAQKAKAQTSSSSGRVKITSKHFKHTSKEARRQGNARELLESMVHRAERKLAEQQKNSHAQVQSAEDKAEEIASELFHKPGSKLTNEEVSLMIEESECIAREEPMCFTLFFDRFRTIDGTCNNLDFPFLGAADTAVARLIPSQYEDGIGSLRGGLQNRQSPFLPVSPFDAPNPSPRIISQTVIRNVSEDEGLSHMLMQWGQFLDHDLSLSPELEDECPHRVDRENCEFTEICEPIRVPDRDPIFGIGTKNNGNCIAFSRSLAACEPEDEPLLTGGLTPREQLNVLTSYIDGSMIYGSDEELAKRIRKYSGGLLLEGFAKPGLQPELPRIFPNENVREDGVEPFVQCPDPGQNGCFLAGEVRVNEQIVLTIMHTLWFREHNRIARELARINPGWGDERLYQEARRIVGALVQKITYLDYLPLILGKKVYDIVIGPYKGYDPRIDPSVTNAFATAAYRYGHTLIRPFFDRLGLLYKPLDIGPLDLLNAFFNPDVFREGFGTDPILRGLASQNARRVDEFLSSALTNNLFREQLDLASLNLQRGRDHGLAPWLTYKRFCITVFPKLLALLPPEDFENTLTLVRFLQLYGSLDTVDLWIGGIAEQRLAGSLLGLTFSCLFGIQFANTRDGDRFYYSRPGIFEPDQLASIQQHTLSSVICDNTDNIKVIQRDAFKTDQVRVPCSEIPRLNLELFKEKTCFFKVNVVPRRFRMPVRSFSRMSADRPGPFSIFGKNAPINLVGVESVCIPVVCPKTGGSSDILTFTSIFLKSFVKLDPNPLLPASVLVGSPELYSAVWPQSLFGGQGTGVYTSEAACMSTNVAAITVGFRSQPPTTQPTTQTPTIATQLPTAQDFEQDPSFLKFIREQESAPDVNSPNFNEEIPEEIRDIVMEPMRMTMEPTTTPSPSVESESDVNDAELMADLEEALKSLNA